MTLFRFYKRTRHRERGVSMIEVAIGLPLFLVIIFGLLWLGYSMNARTSFRRAVWSGLRAAVTRGDPAIMPDTLLTNPAGNYEADGRLLNLLATPDIQSTVGSNDPRTYVAPSLNPNPASAPALTVNGMGIYVHALAYIYENVQESVEGGVRYPCKPDPVPPTKFTEGAGCVQCRFLDHTSAANPKPALAATASVPEDAFLIECKFQPNALFFKPAFALMRFLGGASAEPRMLFTETAYVRRVIETDVEFGGGGP